MQLGDFLWTLVVIFFMVCYFMILFSVISDLFRNHDMSGWIKALWIILLFVVPFLSLLVYVIVYHNGMQERSNAAAKQYQQAQQDYVKQLAGTTDPADQIAKAHALLNSGAISQAEFDSIKTKALA